MAEATRYVPHELELRAPDRHRLHRAGMKARLDYPGPVGEFIAHELDTWIQFGYRFDQRRLTGRLVAHLLGEV